MQAIQILLMLVSVVIGLSQAVKEVRPMIGPVAQPEYLYRYSDNQFHYYSDQSSHRWCRVNAAGVKEYATIP